MTSCIAFNLAFLVGIAWTCCANADELAPPGRTISGDPFRAELRGIDPDWKLRFRQGKRDLNVPAAELVSWGHFSDRADGPQILLANESRLRVSSVELDGERLKATSNTFGELRLPIEVVRGLVLENPFEAASRDRLADSIMSAKGERDRLILTNGDQLRGTITELTAQKCQIESDRVQTSLELARIRAVVFDPGLVEASAASGLRAWIGFSDGSRILTSRMSQDGNSLLLRGPDKSEFHAPLSSVTAIQPLGGRTTYISDLRVSGYRHVPYLSLTWPYRQDRSVLDTMLRSGDKLYLKGIGMHSAGRLTYDLDRHYQRLAGQLAIDDAAAGGGSVVFRVFADDGAAGWKPLYTSPVIRGGSEPVPLRVELNGAKRISLLVDFAERGDQQDYADWLNLHLVE